jgi:putative aldouronate transport system permease protein
MMLPSLLYLFINNYIPMVGIFIAFKRIDFRKGILGSKWVGLSNFEFLFKSNDAWVITRNTICYNLAFILIGTIMAISVAILLSNLAGKMSKKVYQTVILLPYLISTVVVSYLVYAILSTENGFMNNSVLSAFGLEGISWYSSPMYWPFILVFVYLWKNFGYQSIIYYATIVGVDQSYYEAAAIDGATKWQQIKCITLPSIRPTIITLTLLGIGRIFYSDFGLFYQVPMNSGALINATNTIDTYVYRALMTTNNIGMSSAASVFQAFIGFILVLTANFVVSKISKDEALF